jgi:hypothetical protein
MIKNRMTRKPEEQKTGMTKNIVITKSQYDKEDFE